MTTRLTPAPSASAFTPSSWGPAIDGREDNCICALAIHGREGLAILEADL